jgi:CheY-like chemotaxis protein
VCPRFPNDLQNRFSRSNNAFRIVVAENDDTFCYVRQHALTTAGYTVEAYISTTQAWGAVAEGATLDLLVTDVMFHPGEPTGLALVRMQLISSNLACAAEPSLPRTVFCQIK